MNIEACLLLAVFLVSIIAMIGFFITKTKGFGRFATSTFLLLLIVIMSTLLFAADRLEGQVLANIFFAVVGFAAGLFTGKETDTSKKPSKAPTPNAPAP